MKKKKKKTQILILKLSCEMPINIGIIEIDEIMIMSFIPYNIILKYMKVIEKLINANAFDTIVASCYHL